MFGFIAKFRARRSYPYLVNYIGDRWKRMLKLIVVFGFLGYHIVHAFAPTWSIYGAIFGVISSLVFLFCMWYPRIRFIMVIYDKD